MSKDLFFTVGTSGHWVEGDKEREDTNLPSLRFVDSCHIEAASGLTKVDGIPNILELVEHFKLDEVTEVRILAPHTNRWEYAAQFEARGDEFTIFKMKWYKNDSPVRNIKRAVYLTLNPQ